MSTKHLINESGHRGEYNGVQDLANKVENKIIILQYEIALYLAAVIAVTRSLMRS